MSWKKLNRHAPSTNPSKTITYRTFQGTVGSRLITEPTISAGKNEAELALKGMIDTSEEPHFQVATCDNAESRNLDQEQRDTVNILC
jgi:hypothetical protein